MPNSASKRSSPVGVSRAASDVPTPLLLLDNDPRQPRRDEHEAGSRMRQQPRRAQSTTVEPRTMAASAWPEMCRLALARLRRRTRAKTKSRLLRITASRRTTGSVGHPSSVKYGEERKSASSGRAVVVLFPAGVNNSHAVLFQLGA
jgi:hypothetical protein